MAQRFDQELNRLPKDWTLDRILEAVKRELNNSVASGTTTELTRARTGLSKSTLSAIFTGQRTPALSLVPALGRVFYPSDLTAQDRLIKDLRQECNAAQNIRPQRFLRIVDLINGQSLRVKTFDYLPLSGSPATFLSAVIDRFFRLSNISVQALPRDPGQHHFVQVDRGIQDGTIDFTVGIFSTLRRRLFAHFIETPIRMAVSAVALSDHLESRQTLQGLLTTVSEQPTRSNILPITVPGGVGEQHMLSLGFSPKEIFESPELDPDLLARLLLEQKNADTRVIPIVVVDELTALRTLESLHRVGASGFLVFPINSRRAIAVNSAKRDVPEYLFSSCVSRNNQELATYFDDAFRFYLKTELGTTSLAYARLYNELTQEVQELLRHDTGLSDYSSAVIGTSVDRYLANAETRRWLLAHLFGRYVLGLQLDYILASDVSVLPWKQILTQARQRILERLSAQHNAGYVWTTVHAVYSAQASRLLTADDQITDFGLADWENISTQLSDIFDVDLRPFFSRPKKESTNPFPIYAAVCAIRDRLAGRPIEPQTSFRKATQSDVNAISALLAEKHETEADREWMKEFGCELAAGTCFEESVCPRWLVLIAEEGARSTPAPRGTVGIIIINNSQTIRRSDASQPGVIQCCYIREPFRRRGLEAAIIQEAMVMAKRAGWDSLVAVEPAPSSIRGVYLEIGFTPSANDPDALIASL